MYKVPEEGLVLNIHQNWHNLVQPGYLTIQNNWRICKMLKMTCRITDGELTRISQWESNNLVEKVNVLGTNPICQEFLILNKGTSVCSLQKTRFGSGSVAWSLQMMRIMRNQKGLVTLLLITEMPTFIQLVSYCFIFYILFLMFNRFFLF